MIRMQSETVIIDVAEILRERGIEVWGDVSASVTSEDGNHVLAVTMTRDREVPHLRLAG